MEDDLACASHLVVELLAGESKLEFDLQSIA